MSMNTNGMRSRRRRLRKVAGLKPFVERLEARLLLATLETGDFVAEVSRLKDLAFGSGSGLYVAPPAQEQTDFSTLAATLLGGNVAAADTQAAALNYEVVEFTDNVSGDVYHGLREQLVGGQQTRGWGSYFVNFDFQADAVVEVPHPLFDTNTWDVGAKSFRNADARGFFTDGVHDITLSGGGSTIDDTLGNAMNSTLLTVEIDTSVQTVSFQQGVSGYTSTMDTMLQQASPTANNSGATLLNVDSDDPAGSGQDVQTLVRFDNLFGGGGRWSNR